MKQTDILKINQISEFLYSFKIPFKIQITNFAIIFKTEVMRIFIQTSKAYYLLDYMNDKTNTSVDFKRFDSLMNKLKEVIERVD